MFDDIDFDSLSSQELVLLYSRIIRTALNRGLIRTRNFIGEIGESIVIEYYNNTPGLPNLAPAPIGTENIDAISRNGERYSIKTTSNNVTGVFYGLQPRGSNEPDTQRFEYVIICSFSEDYELRGIYELTWETFLQFKHWHSRTNAWSLPVSRDIIEHSRVIFQAP